MEIQEQLKSIAKECKNRILNGEFEFIKSDKHTALIDIDGLKFELWIANNPTKILYIFNDTIFKDFIVFHSEAGRRQVYNHLEKNIKDYQEKVLKKSKEDKIKQLQKELEKLNKQ